MLFFTEFSPWNILGFFLVFSFIGIVSFIFLSTMFDSLDISEKIKNYRIQKKLNTLTNTKLSESHKDYWMWERGDKLKYSDDNRIAILETYSENFVIAKDRDSDKTITLYGKQIKENITCDFKKKLIKAEEFQKNILPEIRSNISSDLKLLESGLSTSSNNLQDRVISNLLEDFDDDLSVKEFNNENFEIGINTYYG